jgi:mannose-6-phosphate isomerase-like protein (cupin superfamily)
MEALRDERNNQLTTREHDERPWGRYTVLGASEGHQVKEIAVDPGQRLSYQRHAHRSEHWFVVTGSGRVVLDGEARDIGVGDAVDVAFGQLHRIGNTGLDQLVFIEVQIGDYLGEDDIERTLVSGLHIRRETSLSPVSSAPFFWLGLLPPLNDDDCGRGRLLLLRSEATTSWP